MSNTLHITDDSTKVKDKDMMPGDIILIKQEMKVYIIIDPVDDLIGPWIVKDSDIEEIKDKYNFQVKEYE